MLNYFFKYLFVALSILMLFPAQLAASEIQTSQTPSEEGYFYSQLQNHSKFVFSTQEVEDEVIHNFLEEDDLEEEDERQSLKLKVSDQHFFEVFDSFYFNLSIEQYIHCVCPKVGHKVKTQVSKIILFEDFRL